MIPHSQHKQSLIDIGRQFYQKQWSVGTSSNYSLKLRDNPLRVLITASGMDKGGLTKNDFVEVDRLGNKVVECEGHPSAETLLHTVAMTQSEINAVLHTHSVWSTILSDRFAEQGYVEFAGFEMLKGLAGIKTHDTSVRLRIFENTQDIGALAREIQPLLDDPVKPLQYGFLLRRHGLYTWGKDLFAARRHVEILEFLLEVQGRLLSLK